MTDDFEQELRASMGRAVPEPPEDPDWAAGARSWAFRARRRRTGLVAVTAVTAAVAALVIVPIVIGDESRSRSAVTVTEETTSTDDATPNSESSPYACPEPDEAKPLVAPRGELAGGAKLARICPSGEIPWTPPLDALEFGLDELVVQINAAKPLPPNTMCTGDLGRAFTMTFQYADGSTADIRGSLSGCDTIVVGGEERRGAQELVRLYAELLAEQRAARTTPAVEAALGCPRPPADDGWGSLVTLGPDPALTDAVLCFRPARSDQGYTTVVLTAEETQVISDDVAARVGGPDRSDGSCAHPGMQVEIRGVNGWGDPIGIFGACDDFELMTGFWNPSPDVQAMLDSLLE